MGVPWWVWPQSVAWVLVHVYLWRRLVRDTTARRGWPYRIATIGMAVLAFAIPGALAGMHALNPAGGRWITWPGFVWYGLVVYLLLVLVATDLVRLGAGIVRRLRRRRGTGEPAEADPGVDADRRRLLARGVAIGAGTLAAATVGYGASAAFATPRLERVGVRLPRLSPSASGFRIAVVGDVHLGAFGGRARMRQIVGIVNDTRPDLVLIPGDLIDGRVADLRTAVEPLRDLRSRHGTFFSTGNHEYLFDIENWIAHLRTIGIRTLRNERVALPYFDLAGVNDVSGAYLGDPPDYRRALSGRNPARPVILMAHQPVQADEAQKYRVDLQISGHTHGGQFFPASLLTALGQPALSGYHRVGRTRLYVTRGTGFWGPPIRVGATPEITLLQLAPEPG